MTEVPDVHRRAIIVDGHCDTPYRLKRHQLGIDDRDETAHVDLDSLTRSGVTASFFAAYVPPHYAGRGAASFAFELIDVIEREIARHPDRLVGATDPEGIRRAKATGKVALMIGVEGGHAIEDSLETLEKLFDRGARYLTLTHVNTNNWADSSGDIARHGGLTSFGRQVVRRMNDLGMLVDISHVSDQTFYQALETTSTPIIASHSSCRALANHPRNLTDAMLRDLASNGGVCMINFFSAFINPDVAAKLIEAQMSRKKNRGAEESGELPDDRTDWNQYCEWFRTLGCPVTSLDRVADHIIHAAEIAGPEHVGIGSDFDGVADLPSGLESVDDLPRLTERLLARGVSESAIEGILGANFLRVFDAVSAASAAG